MTNSELLAVIVDDFTEKLRSEDPPSIQDYCEEHPDLADDIRKVLPSIQAMEQLGSREHSERRFDHKTKKLAFAPDGLIGDFKIIREVGRGGMGVVYEAEQQSLKRQVALKILGPTLGSSEKQLARFEAEAKAVASLHHTNIVSVYGVGEHNGLYFYAMQFIDGMTLADAINMTERMGKFVSMYGPVPETAVDNRIGNPVDTDQGDDVATLESPTAPGLATSPVINEINRSLHGTDRWHEIARLGASVADALDYAHVMGVWHRDIKPSNLILDRQGVIWVTDFGLARHEDREAVTATGDLVGTLKYMAPEQFNGEFDGRSDTYSLGLTIYEMLTQRAGFTENHHVKLMKLKTSTLPPDPRSIRSDIPRDLETIVMKACAINPAHRYIRPAELAADLRRFMEDRPIHARRATWRERVYRWARRNPLPAALGLLSTLLLLSVFGVFAFLNMKLRGTVRELELTQRRTRDQELNQRAEATTTSQMLQHTLDTSDNWLKKCYQRMLPEPLEFELNARRHVSFGVLSQADLDELRWRRLRASGFHGLYAEKSSGEDAGFRRLVRAGEISDRLGEYAEAGRHYFKSLQGFQTMLRFDRASGPLLVEKARLHSLIETLYARHDAGLWSGGRLHTIVDPQLGEEVEIGAETAIRALEDDPGNLLSKDRPARYEYVQILHRKFMADRLRRNEAQLIGNVKSNGEWYGIGIAMSKKAVVISQELLGTLVTLPSATQEAELESYKLMNARIQTDHARLLLLEADRLLNHPVAEAANESSEPSERRATSELMLRNSTTHLSNASRNLRDLLVSETNGLQSENALREHQARGLAYKLELAYLLCIADGPLLGIGTDEAREYLQLLAKTMDRILQKTPEAAHAKRIADVARGLLDGVE